MKKIFAFVLAGILAIGTCMVVFAAPPEEAPSEMAVAQDGKAHSVYVFGTALALVSTDGSIEVSSIGPVGRVDVMMDGVVIKNVSTVDIPAGQRTRMALEEGSIIVKDVTPESSEAVKKQIEDAYATGVESVDIAALTDVTAYKVNKDGAIEGADGKTAPANALEMSVTSVDAAVESFEEVMEEIAAEERAREAAAHSGSGNEEPASVSSSSSSSGSSSSVAPSSNPSATQAPQATPSATQAPTQTPTPTPEATPDNAEQNAG